MGDVCPSRIKILSLYPKKKKMKNVAIAGGLGQLGRCLVDGLAAQSSHCIYVLSRNSSNIQLPSGVKVLQVDYDDTAALTKVLDGYNIDTIICALGILHAAASRSQLNLIRAAGASSVTRRFVLSSFESMHTKSQIESNPLARHVFDGIEEIEKTNLEYTRIVNGWFLDYYGMPHWPTHLHPWNSVINVERKWAVIPGDGTAEANFITTQDLCKFISKLIDLETWPKVTYIIGDKISFNRLLQLAERARGCRFEVVYDNLETLKSGKISFVEKFASTGITDPIEHERFLATLHYEAGTGSFVVVPGGTATLNAHFPDIKITTVEEFLEKCWATQ